MTVPEELAKRIAADSTLRVLQKRIDAGKANFADTFRYSSRAAELLGEVLSKHVPEMLPDAREALCKALLRQRYLDTNAMLKAVQEALDESEGIRITPQFAMYPEERVNQAAHSLADETVPIETIVRRAKSAPATIARSFHDDYIEKNAKFRRRLGLNPVIERSGAGCCAWCDEVAGKYRFGEEPEGMFRRHDNCECVILYDTQVLRGAVGENGRRTKTWEEVNPEKVRGFEPTVNTPEQAKAIEETALQGLTLPGVRDIIRSIDVDDYKMVTYGKGILPEVSEVIIDTMKQCEQVNGFVISEISNSVVPSALHGTPVLQIEPMPNGLLKLNINTEYLSGKTLKEIDAEFVNTDKTVVNSLKEAVIHESGHAISIKGKNVQGIAKLYAKLKNEGLPGISSIALADGAECLAELEVLRSRGASVSDEAAAFYKKYMGRDYK